MNLGARNTACPWRGPTVFTALVLAATCTLIGAQPPTPSSQLEALVRKIDMRLYEQSEADLRALLDPLIDRYWPDRGSHALDPNFDTGGLAGIAAMWFRGYETLGDKRHLGAGLDFAEAIISFTTTDGRHNATCKVTVVDT